MMAIREHAKGTNGLPPPVQFVVAIEAQRTS